MPTNSSPTPSTEPPHWWQRVGRRFAHPFFFVQVMGESMWPLLLPRRRYPASSLLAPGVGRIVVAHHPHEPIYLIKRITKIEDDKLYLDGAVAWSSSFVVDKSAVVGVLISPNISFK